MFSWLIDCWFLVIIHCDPINIFQKINFVSLHVGVVVSKAYKQQAMQACMPSYNKNLPLLKLHHRQSACKSKKIRNYTFYVWIFFRLIGATWKKVQRGLTLLLKSSLLTALVPERFRLWARTTNLITIVSGILHRGERT